MVLAVCSPWSKRWGGIISTWTTWPEGGERTVGLSWFKVRKVKCWAGKDNSYLLHSLQAWKGKVAEWRGPWTWCQKAWVLILLWEVFGHWANHLTNSHNICFLSYEMENIIVLPPLQIHWERKKLLMYENVVWNNFIIPRRYYYYQLYPPSQYLWTQSSFFFLLSISSIQSVLDIWNIRIDSQLAQTPHTLSSALTHWRGSISVY